MYCWEAYGFRSTLIVPSSEYNTEIQMKINVSFFLKMYSSMLYDIKNLPVVPKVYHNLKTHVALTCLSFLYI